MKVLVTGGTGFIGSYVVKELLDLGHKVIVFARTKDKVPSQEGVEFFWGDIRDATSVSEAMAHSDAFIHLAGVLGTTETIQNPRPVFDTNIQAGLNVLEAAALHNVPGVNIAVGNHWEANPYSISKSTVERMVEMYNSYRGTRVSVVRAMNAYGPGQSVAKPYGPSNVRKIMPSFIHRALADDPIEVYGDGSQVMDMVHVENVADVLVAALLHLLDGNDPLLGVEVGSGEPTKVLEVAEEVVNKVGQGSISFLPMRSGESASRPVLADLSTLDPLLPYLSVFPEDFISLGEGVLETIEYYQGVSRD